MSSCFLMLVLAIHHLLLTKLHARTNMGAAAVDALPGFGTNTHPRRIDLCLCSPLQRFSNLNSEDLTFQLLIVHVSCSGLTVTAVLFHLVRIARFRPSIDTIMVFPPSIFVMFPRYTMASPVVWELLSSFSAEPEASSRCTVCRLELPTPPRLGPYGRPIRDVSAFWAS